MRHWKSRQSWHLLKLSGSSTCVHLTVPNTPYQVTQGGIHWGWNSWDLTPDLPHQSNILPPAALVTPTWANPWERLGLGCVLSPSSEAPPQKGPPFPGLTEGPLPTSAPCCWQRALTSSLILYFSFPGCWQDGRDLVQAFISSCLLEALLLCSSFQSAEWYIVLFFFGQLAAELLTE